MRYTSLGEVETKRHRNIHNWSNNSVPGFLTIAKYTHINNPPLRKMLACDQIGKVNSFKRSQSEPTRSEMKAPSRGNFYGQFVAKARHDKLRKWSNHTKGFFSEDKNIST